MLRSSRIDRLLRPGSVAIVGASPEPGSIGAMILGHLDRLGYAGEIHLVSRSRAEINGRRCVPSIDDLPTGVDAVALVVPEAAVLDSVAACARRAVGGVVVFASGFAEVGKEGRAKQERLAAIAREGGLALMGPNCIGFVSYVERVALTFNELDSNCEPPDRGVGMIAQSGAMGSNISAALGSRGLPATYVISSGNEAVSGLEDFLEFLIDDARTGVIVLFVEQVRQPRRFIELVARARKLAKPVIMMHPGRTARARESALSHTGALAGDYALMRAILARESVVLVDTMDELFDATTLLARWPEPPVLGAAIVTNSGAFRGVALDFCEEIGLDLPPLEESTREALKSMLPAYATVGNPLDLTTAGIAQPDIAGRTARVILSDPNIGSLIVSLVGGPPRLQIAKAESVLPLCESSAKPIAFTIMGDQAQLVDEFTGAVRRSGAPFFRSPDRAMRAMACITAYGRAQQAARKAAPALALPPIALRGTGAIPEYQGKSYLAAAGVRVPPGALARTIEDAGKIAERVGYPVVLKAQAADLTHKSDVGGVIAGVSDSIALRDAWKRMHLSLGRARPELALDGVLVEKMAGPGLELIVGARRDPDWGVALMVGLGGVWTEALGDFRILPEDLDEEGVLAEMRKLKGARLLAGMRGDPPRDERCVAKTVAILGQLMRAAPELAEIDINPLRVYADGQGAEALDALLVVRGKI